MGPPLIPCGPQQACSNPPTQRGVSPLPGGVGHSVCTMFAPFDHEAYFIRTTTRVFTKEAVQPFLVLLFHTKTYMKHICSNVFLFFLPAMPMFYIKLVIPSQINISNKYIENRIKYHCIRHHRNMYIDRRSLGDHRISKMVAKIRRMAELFHYVLVAFLKLC